MRAQVWEAPAAISRGVRFAEAPAGALRYSTHASIKERSAAARAVGDIVAVTWRDRTTTAPKRPRYSAQRLPTQLPEQQSAVVMQLPPVERHDVARQVLAEHAKEQQSALPVHDSPDGRHRGPSHTPPAQSPAQQSVFAAQRWPPGRQVGARQRLLKHTPEQQ